MSSTMPKEEHAAPNMSRELTAAGAQIFPLRNLDDVACFADALQANPAALAEKQEKKVYVELRSKQIPASIADVSLLLKRAASQPAWQRLLQCLHWPRRITLVPTVTKCVACGCCDLTLGQSPAHPTVYTDDGAKEGELHHLICDECQARHYMTYATAGTKLGGGQQFYVDAPAQEWFHLTAQTVFHVSQLKRLSTQMLHSHTGWETYSSEYASLHCALLDPERLAHAWLAWSFLHDLADIGVTPTPPLALHTKADMDATLLVWQERIRAIFIYQNGTQHLQHCRSTECRGKIAIGDGHFKSRRRSCANKQARNLTRIRSTTWSSQAHVLPPPPLGRHAS